MKRWSICLVALATLGIASTASADPIKDQLPWVGPQILSIINQHNVWTPTDFAIARYSSLSDQMFYLNKPILIFNYDKYPGPIFNFGNEILIDNLDQLKNKISLNLFHK